MTKQQLRAFTAAVLATFLILYTAASTYSAKNTAEAAHDKADELEDQVNTLDSKVENLEEQIEQLRWR